MAEPQGETAIVERHLSAHEEATDGTEFHAWIGGDHYRTDEGLETRDPAIDEPILEVPRCGSGDVDAAVEAAWDAFDREWASTTPRERSNLLFEWIDVLTEHVDELAKLECLDTGKPITQARGEVEGAIDTLEYYASVCRAQRADHVPAGDDLHLYTKHEPYGVVGQIVPWNFPMWAAAWKLGPALAAGNATVLKPSTDSPLTTIRIAQLSEGILPDGVLNVVTGNGSETGSAIAEHDEIRKVSFTGSTAVGSGVMHAAADRVAPVTLELGGKSPFVVFPDADLDRVVDAVADGIFYSTGEICDAFSRALVHEDVIEEFTERFVEKAESYSLGDPLDEETTMGPLTSESQFETVTDYIETGKREADLLCGGGRPEDPSLSDGWYVEPTVFGDVKNDDTIAREEIFGPVQTIIPFSSYEEAIELANDTRYGLAAGVGTESTSLVHNAANDIEAGLIYVNEYGPILPEAPYGGFKESGVGKDLGLEALDHYRQTKSVYVNLSEPSL
ncbi:aldehyde dehydrogenase family protein [Halalkaliarchaeum sp. AArc-GB]|uniref:aldehyde dehydrogenase family protein n=1 Tax=Halalkaliarchaeum sp. AArc-GB TaxID=3074078 RepID=UPI00285704E6|nr:aldehyde dehydrogenase family protein [Halalkaliarchaeum sp. AArc-GB]MDR5672194.1 aldehyde dehydrogenase family protein [Halalkaliarchaeum sp. AArc-GB]